MLTFEQERRIALAHAARGREALRRTGGDVEAAIDHAASWLVEDTRYPVPVARGMARLAVKLAEAERPVERFREILRRYA